MPDFKDDRWTIVDMATAPMTDLPEGGIPLIYRPTDAERYLQREIVQIANYLRQQRDQKEDNV